MSSRLVLADVDHTLFSPPGREPPLLSFRPVVLGPSREPLGLASPAQQDLWSWLGQWGEVVPITSYGASYLNTLRLSFAPHAVYNHGASLRLRGARDELWHARSVSILEPLQSSFEALAATLAADAAWASVSRLLRRQRDLGELAARLMLTQKGVGLEARAPELRDFIRAHFPDARFWVNAQPGVLAVLASGITKRLAVRRLIERVRPERTVGAGVEASNVPFLRECDFCVIPRASRALEGAGAVDEDGSSL